ncbi:zinc-ribbon domain-containing protein [Ruminococcus flavefaciens]|uniref:zinc-ribbon domain-containing protein n=1 Tax=Ruminococcus flavefaciens TaxID=1265 RepID=UPI0003607451|nr:zinc ribbon domain-containing protein [Ruminococcus flavefaciens]
MYCKYCGKEIDNDAIFCPSCGKSFIDNNPNPQSNTRHSKQYKSPNSNKKGLAIASFVLGIASVLLSFISIISLPCAIMASIFGKKSLKLKMDGKEYAKLGIKLANIGAIICATLVVLGFLLFLLFNFKIL